jgi:predicted nucleic acid-binding protein
MADVSYIDSSALLRESFDEGDRSLLHAALARPALSSQLLAVEVPVGIAARFHGRAFGTERRNELLLGARRLIEGISLVDIDDDVRSEAVGVGLDHLIRGMDAIHLGTAVVIARQQRRHGNALRFCTADRRLADVAGAVLGASAVDLLPPLP